MRQHRAIAIKEESIVKKLTLHNAGGIALAAAALSLSLAGRAQADCSHTATLLGMAPRLSALAMPAGITLPKETDTSAVVPDHFQSSDADPSIAGLWHSKSFSDGQITDEAFEQWNSDGTEVLNDNPPPQTGNVCLGVFVKSAQSTYKLKHPSWTYDSNGNLNGTAIIRELVIVGRGGNSYSGTYTVNLYDLKGNHIAQFGGTVEAERITVDF